MPSKVGQNDNDPITVFAIHLLGLVPAMQPECLFGRSRAIDASRPRQPGAIGIDAFLDNRAVWESPEHSGGWPVSCPLRPCDLREVLKPCHNGIEGDIAAIENGQSQFRHVLPAVIVVLDLVVRTVFVDDSAEHGKLVAIYGSGA
ncbi:hypothetical protein [Mesorhizobium sp. CN2-181]|uniref:hypothetical protein n=1 Tax=Mesorhizobium yinganensis TaxID=3157707 RepID=UPI0032B86180